MPFFRGTLDADKQRLHVPFFQSQCLTQHLSFVMPLVLKEKFLRSFGQVIRQLHAILSLLVVEAGFESA